jgi:D-3-phosphoglycerate dehydrogenase
MKKLFFACKIEDIKARSRIAELGDLHEDPSANSPEKILAGAQGADIVVVPYTSQMLITPAVIDGLDGLRLVGTTYGGVGQNVDEKYALKKQLTVIHTGPTRIRPMAEYTLSLILTSLTQIANYHYYMRQGEAWPRTKFGRTRILHNRSVGIIGYGLIGKGIADLLANFTSSITIHSRHSSRELLAKNGYQKADSLEEIFSNCEVVILAGGYTPETHYMVKGKHFELMQDEALFVNIARGQMVKQEEMIKVASRKNIYLALDVFENEPLEEDSPLRQNDRFLLAPHRANAPREFEKRWEFLADELCRFYQGLNLEAALTPTRAAVMSKS